MQASGLAGCSVSQVRYWARVGLVAPGGGGGTPGRGARYTFRDLVALRVVRSVLDALGSGPLALFVPVGPLARDVEAEVTRFDHERAAFVDQLRRDSSG